MRESAPLTLKLLMAYATAGVLGGSAVAAEPPLKPVPADAPIPAFIKDVKPILTKYCTECHQGDMARAGLDFEAFKDKRAALNRRQV